MRTLYKSKENAVIFGVLGGLGEYFNVDPVLLRVIVVVFSFLSSGTLILPYLLLALFMPNEPNDGDRGGEYRHSRRSNRRRYERRRGYGKDYERPKRKEAEDVTEDDWSDF